jgi:hypothetical protein
MAAPYAPKKLAERPAPKVLLKEVLTRKVPVAEVPVPEVPVPEVPLPELLVPGSPGLEKTKTQISLPRGVPPTGRGCGSIWIKCTSVGNETNPDFTFLMDRILQKPRVFNF